MSRADSWLAASPPVKQGETPSHHEVSELIRRHGPISFARFMQIALYGQHGYYATQRNYEADYLTSPQTHPEFGACVARCLLRMWNAMGNPKTFAVAEIGAGDGALMRDVLASLTSHGSEMQDFAAVIEYTAYDSRPARGGLPDTVKSVDALEFASGQFQCVLSNELLDAFPVHRFTVIASEVRELMVDIDDDGMLCEIVGEPIDSSFATRLGHPLTAYPDGYVGEIALGISDWVADVARKVERGYVLTIDYGHPRQALYHPERAGGTLRCYRQHVLGSDPFRWVGEQDMTAHVDFTYLQECLGARGFAPSAPLMSQADFLYAHGYEDAMLCVRRDLMRARDATDISALQQELADLRALSDPRGLGAFLVAIHGIEVPELVATSC